MDTNAPAPVASYRVVLADPQAHRIVVHCRIESPDPAGQQLSLPAWIPGSYLIRDFSRHVIRIEAECRGQSVAVTRTGLHRLRCAPVDGSLELRWEVHAFDASVRKAWLDERRALINGTSLFWRPLGLPDGPFSVCVERPQSPGCTGWQLATAMPAVDVDADGYGWYRAADYDELIDHPMAAGALLRVPFTADGIPHEMVLSGCVPEDLDRERLARDLATLCATHRALFGGEPALERYLFLTHVAASGYGGLEHRASSALVCARGDLPRQGLVPGQAYRQFLGLCSHEYFHLWNVKRIRPAAVAASDLTAPAPFRDLWHFEGVTSYYDDLMLRRAGLIDLAQYLELLARAATRVLRTPGRHVHSLSEASFEAWTKYYQTDENTPNQTVSYYVKGSLAALCIDLHLRLHADSSLDAVMQALWQRHGRSGRPVPEGGVEALIRELAGAAAPPLDEWIHGTGDLPLEELLGAFAVRLRRRAPVSPDDGGGAAPSQATPLAGWTGIVPGEGARVSHVLEGSPAQRAGITGGDELVAVDGLRCGSDPRPLLAALRAGSSVRLHYFRHGELREAELTVASPPEDCVEIAPDPEADAVALARRRAWIGA